MTCKQLRNYAQNFEQHDLEMLFFLSFKTKASLSPCRPDLEQDLSKLTKRRNSKENEIFFCTLEQAFKPWD